MKDFKNFEVSAEAIDSSVSGLQNGFLGITLALSSFAVLGSFALQAFVAQPCVFCWILRGLAVTVLIASLVGLKLKMKGTVIKAVAAFSMLGVLVSGYLIYIESFASDSLLCAATSATCSGPPTILGFTPSVYALGMFAVILGSSMLGSMSSKLAGMKRMARVKWWTTVLVVVSLGLLVAYVVFHSTVPTMRFVSSEGPYMSSVYSLSPKIDPVLNSGKMAFVYFYTDWCHYCAKQTPIVNEFETLYKDEVVFIRVNGDENTQVLGEFGVNGFPTMLLIFEKSAKGYLYRDFRGFNTESTLKASIDKVLAAPLQSVESVPVIAERRYPVELTLAFSGLAATIVCAKKRSGVRGFLPMRRLVNQGSVVVLAIVLAASFLSVFSFRIEPVKAQLSRPSNFYERCEPLIDWWEKYITEMPWGDTWMPVYDGDNMPKQATGEVRYARVSSMDHPFNHESQDFVFNVRLDPEYYHLLSGVSPDYGQVENLGDHEMHMEWETDYFHQFAWPSVGDRVWLTGLWIWDCGHEPKTEFHPVVGIATQRQVPMRWSSDSSLWGTYTPGVRTDIWFNTRGGGATHEYLCNDIHHPGHGDACITAEDAQYQPWSNLMGSVEVWQDWEFDVQMPPRPPEIYPGYYPEIQYRILSGPVGGGHNPIVTPLPNESKIHVKLPLDTYVGQTYSRSIEARWDYVPLQPAREFYIEFDSISIRDKLEGWGDQGEYRLAANVNDKWFWLSLPGDVTDDRYYLDQSQYVAVFPSDNIHLWVSGYEDDKDLVHGYVDDNPGVAEQRYYSWHDFGVISESTSGEYWMEAPYRWDESWHSHDPQLYDRVKKEGDGPWYHNLFAREGYSNEGNHDGCYEDWKAPQGSCFSLRYRIYEVGHPYVTPSSRLTFGSPSYISSDGKAVITSDTSLTLTASGLDYNRLQYRYWKVGDPMPSWSRGRFEANSATVSIKLEGVECHFTDDMLICSPFPIPLEDGVYILEYAAQGYQTQEPYGDGTEQRHVQILHLNNGPPQTTLEVDEPRFTDALGNTYVTSDTVMEFNVDDVSGAPETYYKVDDGEWKNYMSPRPAMRCFRHPTLDLLCTGEPIVLGDEFNPLTRAYSDGPHNISYYSIDRLGHVETTKQTTLILDNALQYITLNANPRVTISPPEKRSQYGEPGQTVRWRVAIYNPNAVTETYRITTNWYVKLHGLDFEFDNPYEKLSKLPVTLGPGGATNRTLSVSLPLVDPPFWDLVKPPIWTYFRVNVESVSNPELSSFARGRLAIVDDDDTDAPAGSALNPPDGQIYTHEYPSDIRLSVRWTDDSDISWVYFYYRYESPDGFSHWNWMLPQGSSQGVYWYDILRSEWTAHLNQRIQWFSTAFDNDTDRSDDSLMGVFPTTPATISVVIPSYGVDISIDPQVAGNELKTTKYTVSIHNTGNVPDTYDPTLQGLDPTWFYFSQASITVNPSETATVDLFVTPPSETAFILKDYNFRVTAASQNSPSATDSADATLTLDFTPMLPTTPEGSLTVAVIPEASTLTMPAMTTQTQFPVDLNVEVYNNENFDDAITIALTNTGIPLQNQAHLQWFSWTTQKVFIPEGGSITIPVTATIPRYATPGFKYFNASATSVGWAQSKATTQASIFVLDYHLTNALERIRILREHVSTLYEDRNIDQYKHDRIIGDLARTETDITNAINYLDTVKHGFDDKPEGLIALKFAVSRLEYLKNDLKNWVKYGYMPSNTADQIIQQLDAINTVMSSKAKFEAQSERALSVDAVEDSESRLGYSRAWLWNEITYADNSIVQGDYWLAQGWLSKAVDYYKTAFGYSQRTIKNAYSWSWSIPAEDWIDQLEQNL
ncbi:MAG TPA: thioredoxin domain-containing protein [Candidatus Bathyarchaeia archaeon]|nr:thioredoxin domain-containing protein [Candidatus Bathyarchaeia archaeon]